MAELDTVIRKMLRDVLIFTEHGSGLKLRKYQADVISAIVDSVINRRGLTFVVIFPRQSGKNELQAQLETYLLMLFSRADGELVKISPTWRPQSLNAMRRLERVLARNLLTQKRWDKEQGYIYRIGSARIFFLSGAPTANVVGATASTLLECDEAQDVLISKWDKDVAPMAASTNATRVFWGTAWTSKTLLAREMRAALEAERQDGIRRVFRITADEVGAEVEAYKEFVAEEIRKHGRQHPFVKTQFFSEEIDAEGGMFPPRRMALMRGDHPRRFGPEPGRVYAFLLDVAGEDEAGHAEGDVDSGGKAGALSNPGRDATALTIVEVDLSALSDPVIAAPIYRVVDRRLWVGTKHTAIYGQLLALSQHWEPRYLVVDATGVGAGLTSFLQRSLNERVIPFVFNSATKSKLGWDFLSVVESGRYRDYKPAGLDADQAQFWRELEHCQMEVLPGPDRRLRWGVPDGTRGSDGELVHDDLALSAALAAVLDEQPWGLGESAVVRASDPLAEMKEVY